MLSPCSIKEIRPGTRVCLPWKQHRREDLRSRGSPSPGSIWHAELCSRPCIYFVSGSCIHGDACPFCHLPHEKRPPHLDKRNRRLLKAISGAELYSIIMPELAQKLQDLSNSLPQLWVALAPQMESFIGASTSRVDRRFQAVFRSMTIRQLLNTLGQKLQDEGRQTPEGDQLQHLMMLIELLASSSLGPKMHRREPGIWVSYTWKTA